MALLSIQEEMVHLVKNILLGPFLQILIERQIGVELTLEHLDMIYG